MERDREARSSREQGSDRFRVKVRTSPDGVALLSSTRTLQSVTKGKEEAEAVFGPLEWRAEAQGDVRVSALVESS